MVYDKKIIEAITEEASPLTEKPEQIKDINIKDYEKLLSVIHDKQIVMLGEATHGTHEFYEIRAQISKYLITHKGFHAIAIEGDWPDAYQINSYIQQQKFETVYEALASFDRFPTWMWRNVPMVRFIDWLYNHNKQHEPAHKIGFYGLDLYSLGRSIDIVINSLKEIDPVAAEEARLYYACFNQYRHNPQDYGYAVFRKFIHSCADKVVEELWNIHNQLLKQLDHSQASVDELFYIEQNARVVKNAEKYYRSLFVDEVSNWNIRDSHMLETVNKLIEHYQAKGIKRPKIIIWAHNSHIGNAAATQMSKYGEYNIGELIKKQFGSDSLSVGFTTYEGMVSAAPSWHQPVERKYIKKAMEPSYEALFHATQIPNFLLMLQNATYLPQEFFERAIGVVYHPHTERESHYFLANLAKQFDAVIHLDKTTALEPVDKTPQWISGEAPETYPSGL